MVRKPTPGSWTSRVMRSEISARNWSPTRDGRVDAITKGEGRRDKTEISLDTVSHGSGDPLDDERFDHVADLDVVEPVEADAAFETGLHLRHVVFEAAQ